jgi:glycosyltransferase involved in cell wall biosynthesis
VTPTAIDRARQTRRLLRTEGYAGVAARIVKRVADRVAPPGQQLPALSREDLLRAGEIAASGWVLPPALPTLPGQPLTIALVCASPGPGSGGHTTMFRMVAAMEGAGHRCIVYLRDEHGWSLDQHRETIRTWWPRIGAEIRDAADGIEDAHAIFATSWDTAYPVLASPAKGVRFYFVQDFEPWFYAAGSEALLAESTYRFGFHGITAGRWLAEHLRVEYGMAADHFDFGCDPGYALDASLDPGTRTGICLYTRPDTPRRAFELAVLALDLFAERHPEVDIHLFGKAVKRLPFRVVDHGLCTPAQLNDLYNRCIAGITLSATNVSLVPHEMLAAGCLPVVNDAEHNRVVLDNSEVVYAPATPFELADTLCALVDRPAAERAAAAQAAAASVRGASWDDAGATVERVVRRVVDRASAAVRPAPHPDAGPVRA